MRMNRVMEKECDYSKIGLVFQAFVVVVVFLFLFSFLSKAPICLPIDSPQLY